MCGVRLRNKGSEKRRSHSPHGRFGLQDALTLETSREDTWRAQWQRVWEGVSVCPKCAGSPTTSVMVPRNGQAGVESDAICPSSPRTRGSRTSRIASSTTHPPPKRVGFDPRPVPV